MRIPAEGTIGERIYAAGYHIYPAYIIQGGRRNLVVEAGLNVMGPDYYGAVKKFLGDPASLDLLLLTHGHYDHMGALPYLKRKIPSLDLRAHPSNGILLDKEKIVKAMNFLSQQIFLYYQGSSDQGISSYYRGLQERLKEDVAIHPVPFGAPLVEGDVIDLGDWSCEVLETPGHTQDHLSFFLPEPGVLFPGEALGNPNAQNENDVKIEFLTSYTGYINSIEKLMNLAPRVKIIAMSHLFYYTGDDVPRFMEMAMRDTIQYRKLIESYLDMENGDVEQAISTMLRVEYDEKGNVPMERNAYMANLSAQIKAVAAAQ